MSDDERLVIRHAVWSGFVGPDETEDLIDDLLLDDPDLDADDLRAAVADEFARKAEAETAWPTVTDCDRLDRAFAALDNQGILALHDAGYTMSDGHGDAAEALAGAGAARYRGYCFYHRQDIESALDGGHVHIAFDDLDATHDGRRAIAVAVVAALTQAGLSPDWPGDPDRRIALRSFAWQRRLHALA